MHFGFVRQMPRDPYRIKKFAMGYQDVPFLYIHHKTKNHQTCCDKQGRGRVPQPMSKATGKKVDPTIAVGCWGRSFAHGSCKADAFASAPALEALRPLISDAVTVRNDPKTGDKVLMTADVNEPFLRRPCDEWCVSSCQMIRR